MKSVTIREAKANLSRLVVAAARGEPFVIAKAGKPLVKVVAFDARSPDEVCRLGFLAERLKVPDDFDRMGEDQIADLFPGKGLTPSTKS